MCGRAACTLAPETLQVLVKAKHLDERLKQHYRPRYNLCPTHCCPVLVKYPDTQERSTQTQTQQIKAEEAQGEEAKKKWETALCGMRWGLLGVFGGPINARAETVLEKKNVVKLATQRRCVMLVMAVTGAARRTSRASPSRRAHRRRTSSRS